MFNEFVKILEDYPSFVLENPKFKTYDSICQILPEKIKAFLRLKGINYDSNGRNGAGNYSDCPFIRINNRKVSSSTKEGLYLVYLFRKDFDGFYLSLNQGTENLDMNELEHCAKYIRNQIDDSYSKEPINLGSNSKRPKNYQNANIVSKFYEKGKFSKEELENDLLSFCQLYREIIDMNNLENIQYKDFTKIIMEKKIDINTLLKAKTKIVKLEHKNFDYIIDNYLFYGVPGCGKSYKVNDIVDNKLNIKPENKYRTTFYYDYTYSDFIGQITPNTLGGNLTYEIAPGIFSSAIARAYQLKENGSDEKVALIIEEINRGNAPAIFGDVFQLLDRDNNGRSEYCIKNSIIANVLGSNPMLDIYIPDNMYVFATMNTSDQNVFPLDTAFKRRWLMQFVDDKDSDPTLDNKIVKNLRNNFDVKTQTEISNPEEISWDEFHRVVNKIIQEQLVGTYNSEDKGIGYFFVKNKEFNDVNTFAEKVLQFLWFDVFNLKHEDIFNFSSYRDLIKAFESPTGLLMFGNDQKALFREACKPN